MALFKNRNHFQLLKSFVRKCDLSEIYSNNRMSPLCQCLTNRKLSISRKYSANSCNNNNIFQYPVSCRIKSFLKTGIRCEPQRYSCVCKFSVSNVTQTTDQNNNKTVRDKDYARNSSHPNDIKEKILTIPNILTASRIIVTPYLGYLVIEQSYTWAFGLFVVAGITDVIDGYIARNYDQKTVLGSALDPLADKLLISVLTVTLTVSQLLPVPLAVVILGRDVLLVLASLYYRYISLPHPKTLSRYLDVTNATVKLHPSNISKINTFLQITVIASTLAAPVFGFLDHFILQCLWYLAGSTTVISGVDYVINRNKSVEILHDCMKHKQ